MHQNNLNSRGGGGGCFLFFQHTISFLFIECSKTLKNKHFFDTSIEMGLYWWLKVTSHTAPSWAPFPPHGCFQSPRPSIPDDILSLSGLSGAPGVVNNSLYKKFYISGDKDRKKNPYLWSGLNRVSVGGNKVFKDESISFNSSANCVKP